MFFGEVSMLEESTQFQFSSRVCGMIQDIFFEQCSSYRVNIAEVYILHVSFTALTPSMRSGFLPLLRTDRY